jgi:hypothetical protein
MSPEATDMARVRAASLVSLTLTVISAATSAQNYAAPKTPWGDPDLQGIWSGDSAFGARRAGAHSSGERRRFLPQRQRLGDEVFPADVAHRRSTERTCEPPVDGAEKRRTPQGTYGSGPFNSPEDFTAYDRCLTLGVVGSMTPKIYGNGYASCTRLATSCSWPR